MSIKSESILLVTVFAAPLAAVVLNRTYMRLIKGTKMHWFHNESMPRELRSARLILNEAVISTDEPKRIRGQVDQGFRTKKGLLVLVDTKTRSHHQVHQKDVEQLSLYAYILRSNHVRDVARHGYVRTVVFTDNEHRSVHYHRVPLLSGRELAQQFDWA